MELGGTYEAELQRAELLGVEPMSMEKWEEQAKARVEAQVEQEQVEIAQEVDACDEKTKTGHGKLDELNSILSATQLKMNKFKAVCGSFTSLLSIRSGSPAPSEDSASTSNGEAKSSMNKFLHNLEEMENIKDQPDLELAKDRVHDIEQNMHKNLDALDSLMAKAEHADITLQQQNKQIKGLLKKTF